MTENIASGLILVDMAEVIHGLYGYRNVYQLGPLIDIGKAMFEFEGSLLA